jgi:hypothetical protein
VPTVEGVREIRVTNATLTDEGKGVVSVDIPTDAEVDAIADALIATHAADDDAHHAVYTDAMAIAAVQGEATLDLTGDVTVAANKTLAVDHVIEKTGAHGVVIDGVELKDDAVETDAIRGLRETSGPTALTVGTITDGEYLKRVAGTLVSGTPAGGSGGGITDSAFQM